MNTPHFGVPTCMHTYLPRYEVPLCTCEVCTYVDSPSSWHYLNLCRYYSSLCKAGTLYPTCSQIAVTASPQRKYVRSTNMNTDREGSRGAFCGSRYCHGRYLGIWGTLIGKIVFATRGTYLPSKGVVRWPVVNPDTSLDVEGASGRDGIAQRAGFCCSLAASTHPLPQIVVSQCDSTLCCPVILHAWAFKGCLDTTAGNRRCRVPS